MHAVEGQRPLIVGRYAVYSEIAIGGMASVHFGRLLGPAGFQRTVAIKRLHPQFAQNPEFVAQFLDEARLTAHIQHPNVVQTLDIVTKTSELWIVMQYVEGETLSRMTRTATEQGHPLSIPVAVTIISDVLHGLHAAHEAKNSSGERLAIVHRDVSPQNILVGTDGVARVLDFGIAKAVTRVVATRQGQLKGKLAYMAPEQAAGWAVDRRTDVFATAVVLWETLTGERLFGADDQIAVLNKVLNQTVAPPSSLRPDIPTGLDVVVLKALSRDPKERFQTAAEFAACLEASYPGAVPREVGRQVQLLCSSVLEERTQAISEIAQHSSADNLPSHTVDRLFSPRHREEFEPTVTAPAPSFEDTSPSAEMDTGQLRPRWIATALAILAVGLMAAIITLVPRILFVERAPPARFDRLPKPVGAGPPAAAAMPSDSLSAKAPPNAQTTEPAEPAASPAPSQNPVSRTTERTKPLTKPACDPPTYTTADGIIKFKRECL